MEIAEPTFTPERLLFARERAGLTRLELGRLADVSPQSISNYEKGQNTPRDTNLHRLADALGVPVAFFSGDPMPELEGEMPNFRALTKMAVREKKSALATGSLAIKLNQWLEERLHLPDNQVPVYERGAAEPTLSAQRLRAQWEMGYTRIRSVVQLLESHGVRVFALPENLSSVDAFSFWYQGTPYVILNMTKTRERGRFDACHELGHLVLHSSHDVEGRVKEYEANRFAASLLMPEEDVLASGLRNANVEKILAAKGRWGVSAMALTHRLREVGLTTEWTYTTTCRQLAQMGYRRGEPDTQDVGRESSQLLTKAFGALRQRGIRQADVAADLDWRPEVLQELLHGLVMQQVQGEGTKSRSTATLQLVRDA